MEIGTPGNCLKSLRRASSDRGLGVSHILERASACFRFSRLVHSRSRVTSRFDSISVMPIRTLFICSILERHFVRQLTDAVESIRTLMACSLGNSARM